MRNEKDLYIKFVVIKIDDINKYMSEEEKKQFWNLFWNLVDEKKSVEDKK